MGFLLMDFTHIVNLKYVPPITFLHKSPNIIIPHTYTVYTLSLGWCIATFGDCGYTYVYQSLALHYNKLIYNNYAVNDQISTNKNKDNDITIINIVLFSYCCNNYLLYRQEFYQCELYIWKEKYYKVGCVYLLTQPVQ